MVKAIISYKFWVTVCRCKLVFVFLDVCLGFLGEKYTGSQKKHLTQEKYLATKIIFLHAYGKLLVIYTFHFSESRQNCVFLSQNL